MSDTCISCGGTGFTSPAVSCVDPWHDAHDKYAEPTPDRQPSDAAVEAAARGMLDAVVSDDPEAYQSWDEMTKAARDLSLAAGRAALEAAYRVDVPRPLLDREAVTRSARDFNYDRATLTGHVDTVMDLARPMPTQEQIAETLVGIVPDTNEGINLRLVVADAMLALLNGTES